MDIYLFCLFICLLIYFLVTLFELLPGGVLSTPVAMGHALILLFSAQFLLFRHCKMLVNHLVFCLSRPRICHFFPASFLIL